tara:strand:- start:240 stop:722 length:483 start_codon:yes stop_codon:yes gene_type:complete
VNKRKPKSSKALMFRVTPEGTLAPDDDISRQTLRKRGFRVGDVLSADPKKPRNLYDWRRAHKLAQLLIENIDDFASMDAHQVLKRIQIEADIGCDSIAIKLPGFGTAFHRVPLSLNFADMDEGEFQVIYGQFCQHIIDSYWAGLTQDQIERMANLVGLAA